MNRIVALIWLLAITVPAAAATNSADHLDKSLSSLPKTLELSESRPQHCVFTCDYFQYEPSKFSADKTRVTAEYTRGLPEKCNGTMSRSPRQRRSRFRFPRESRKVI